MVGEQIKSVRTELGITQKELADIVGISRVAMNRIENNIAPKTRAVTALRIARALNVSMDFLFCDECLDTEPENSEN